MKIARQRKMYNYYLRDVIFINNCRKIFIKFGIYILLLSIVLIVAVIVNVTRNHHDRIVHHRTRYPTDLKYILLWKHPMKNKKNFINKDTEYATGQTPFIKQNCKYINCFISYNKSLLHGEENFDAIVFNVRDISTFKMENTNLKRSRHQLYIFKSLESAEWHPLCNKSYDNFFNWTWTYKLDSDVPHPFLNVHDNKNNVIGPSWKMKWNQNMKNTNNFKKLIYGKNKAVAAILGNCKIKMKHQDFLKQFRQELKGYNYTLDTYGPCGERRCGKGGVLGCYKTIENEYFFQLVLEDFFSEDFVSEKVAKAMMHLAIPIVNGRSNLTNFLPPGSYVNARAFDMKKLGAILDYLIKNIDKYSYFFDWKSYYRYSLRPRYQICDLCTKLNQKNKSKVYKKFRAWWNPNYKDACARIRLYNIFNNL